jgi:hemoglobin-like flavoprotein
MTPEQLDIVVGTAGRLACDPERFARAFDDHLFNVSPETCALFAADDTERRAELVDDLVELAELARDLDRFVERARMLGVRYRHHGVRAGNYDCMEEALMAALTDVLDDEFTADVAAAWKRGYRLMSETMLEGAGDELFIDG